MNNTALFISRQKKGHSQQIIAEHWRGALFRTRLLVNSYNYYNELVPKSKTLLIKKRMSIATSFFCCNSSEHLRNKSLNHKIERLTTKMGGMTT